MDENKNQQTSPPARSGQIPPNLPTSFQNPTGQSPSPSNQTPAPRPYISPLPKGSSAPPTSSVQTSSSGQAPSSSGVSSSIRTMQGDIEAILKGKTPSGVPVKTEVQSKPALPPLPPPTPPLASQFRPPVVKLGETEKAKPLISPASPSVLKPPLPSKPTAGINVPPPKKNFLSKQILIVLALVFISGAGAYWYFIIKPQSQIAEPTPLPTRTPLPLSGGLVIRLSGDPIAQLNDFIYNTELKPAEIKDFDVLDDQNQNYNFGTFSQKFSINLPQDFSRALSLDNMRFLIYGQTENFGEIIFEKRFGFIAKLDPAFTRKVDEESLLAGFKDIFALNLDNPESPGFQDNNYKGEKIRYRNFPVADQTIDYAIINVLEKFGDTGSDSNVTKTSNGDVIKKYFVMTNSRESMYAVIDNFHAISSKFSQGSPAPLAPTQK